MPREWPKKWQTNKQTKKTPQTYFIRSMEGVAICPQYLLSASSIEKEFFFLLQRDALIPLSLYKPFSYMNLLKAVNIADIIIELKCRLNAVATINSYTNLEKPLASWLDFEPRFFTSNL